MSEDQNQKLTWYEKVSHKLEDKGFSLTVYALLAVVIGSAVEVFFSPVFGFKVDKIDAIKPYTALELAGRDVYQAEGCYYCHTQMVRPFKWETDRWYGSAYPDEYQYSIAAEFVYDHPFQWGSKRTGPDLGREAGANKTEKWQRDHLINPQDTVEGSIMPAYPHLFKESNLVGGASIQAHMKALKTVGVPYTDAEIEGAITMVEGKTKGDALVAYLMKLGRDLKK